MLKLTIGNDPGMTTFAFIVAVLQVVTWPLAIVTIVVLFHGRILDAISRLAEISFPGGSVKFGERLAELKATSREAVPAQVTEPVADQPELAIVANRIEDTRQLAEKLPEAAILEGFRNVESVLLNIANSLGIPIGSKGVNQIVQQLAKREVLSKELLQIFSGLRELRGQVAHSSGPAPSSQQALEYLDQCNIFISAVQNAFTSLQSRPVTVPQTGMAQ
jgi:hypothetical protein